MMHFGYGLGGGVLALIFWGLFGIAFIIGLVFMIIFLVRSARMGGWYRRHPGTMAEPSAKEILQARYARGEITQAEYKKILADLEK